MSLSSRREFLTSCLFCNIINGIMDFPRLIASMPIRVPKRTNRSSRLLYSINPKTIYCSYSSHNRVVKVVNQYCDAVDFFDFSLLRLKRMLKNFILYSKRACLLLCCLLRACKMACVYFTCYRLRLIIIYCICFSCIHMLLNFPLFCNLNSFFSVEKSTNKQMYNK